MPLLLLRTLDRYYKINLIGKYEVEEKSTTVKDINGSKMSTDLNFCSIPNASLSWRLKKKKNTLHMVEN